MANGERWLVNYETFKQWTLEHGHFPNRAKIEGRGLLNWYKYNAKLIKQGKLSPEREQMIHELEEMRNRAINIVSQCLLFVEYSLQQRDGC